MNLIIIHKANPAASDDAVGGKGVLRFALESEPIASVVLEGLGECLELDCNKPVFYAVPEQWDVRSDTTGSQMLTCIDGLSICPNIPAKAGRNSWLLISNGRLAAQADTRLLNKLLAESRAEVMALNVDSALADRREKLRLTAQGKVAGFRRLYCDSVEPAPVWADWPHYLFVRTDSFDKLLDAGCLTASFSELLNRCRSKSLKVSGVRMGGVVFDLNTERGLLDFCRVRIARMSSSKLEAYSSVTMSRQSRLAGNVIFGKNVQLGPAATVIGPTVIAGNVKIEQGAVINTSVVGPGIEVPPNTLVQNSFVRGSHTNWKLSSRPKGSFQGRPYTAFAKADHKRHITENFRRWPRLSYAGGFKRIADIVIAVLVLVLFAPIIPFIALAIKVNSPGPVFFRHKRQGRYGKIFSCLKFRTMKPGADKMQDTLRFVSQVDGPQFKIEDDPRISAVGRFLRETYLDEIPQFINVLLGQMSVVGPRPSPESENTLCPLWRDARLSVRPGISGLWQICRTRQPMKDFQEWIHYDTEYVRNLSLKLDLWISWKTTKKLFDNFISQF
jgi:lipopolysaccharide/colanic/teichoic acid biosynthesis glycosyltransferase/carbonic anhydrase/acetyltransferase-like protein (isoleucine patch superfamily)